MVKAKRARKVETLKQPSLYLRLRAPYFYPNCGGRRVTGVPTATAFDSLFSKWHEISMSRPLRIQYPGAWYHVMKRGRRREAVDMWRVIVVVGFRASTQPMLLRHKKPIQLPP